MKNRRTDGSTLNDNNRWSRNRKRERRTIGNSRYKSTMNITDIAIHFSKMIEEFETTWDRHLGRINIDNYQIELAAAQKTVHYAPYGAGPKAREVGRSEIDKM